MLVPGGGPGLAPVWASAGVLIACLILSDRSRWLVLFAISAAVNLASAAAHGYGMFPTLAMAVLPAGEAVIAAWFVRRSLSEPFGLDRVAHTWSLVVWATVVPAAGGIIAGSLLMASGDAGFLDTVRSWWLGDTLGMIVIAPLVIGALAWRKRLRVRVTPWRVAEYVFVLGGLAAATIVIFGEVIDPTLTAPTYVLPFLLWAAFRFGPGGASTAVFLVFVIALWNAAHGNGPLTVEGASAASMVLRSQGAMTIAAVSFLSLASVVAERRRIAHENARLVVQLQQALAEVKTLRGFIPICAWCHKVRDDAGFWQQIEMYLDARTDATFSHSICPACEREAHEEVESHERPNTPTLS